MLRDPFNGVGKIREDDDLSLVASVLFVKALRAGLSVDFDQGLDETVELRIICGLYGCGPIRKTAEQITIALNVRPQSVNLVTPYADDRREACARPVPAANLRAVRRDASLPPPRLGPSSPPKPRASGRHPERSRRIPGFLRPSLIIPAFAQVPP